MDDWSPSPSRNAVSEPAPNHKSPKRVGQVTVGMYVHVDDVDDLYRRAKTAGAELEGAPADQPSAR